MDGTVEIVKPRSRLGLADYESVASLARAVRELRAEASSCATAFAGRRVWMVSSTSAGGGVAEMMPALVTLLRELGVDVSWAVMRTPHEEFFRLTKRLH